MISLPITALFIGVFALLQIPLTVMVGYRREPWGMREFGVRTIDGHRIMFGQEVGEE